MNCTCFYDYYSAIWNQIIPKILSSIFYSNFNIDPTQACTRKCLIFLDAFFFLYRSSLVGFSRYIRWCLFLQKPLGVFGTTSDAFLRCSHILQHMREHLFCEFQTSKSPSTRRQWHTEGGSGPPLLWRQRLLVPLINCTILSSHQFVRFLPLPCSDLPSSYPWLLL